MRCARCLHVILLLFFACKSYPHARCRHVILFLHDAVRALLRYVWAFARQFFLRLVELGFRTRQVIPLLLERALPALLATPALLPPYTRAFAALALWGPDPLPLHIAPHVVPGTGAPSPAGPPLATA